jgi:hypothetical protein
MESQYPIQNESPLDKRYLVGDNDPIGNGVQLDGHRLRHNLEDHVYKRNWPELQNLFSPRHFRNQRQNPKVKSRDADPT